MTGNTALTLRQIIVEYLQWIISSGYPRSTYNSYRSVLNTFFHFIVSKQIDWEDIFTLDTLNDFEKTRSSASAVRNLFRYLFEQKRIPQSIDPQQHRPPDPYENYLKYYKQT